MSALQPPSASAPRPQDQALAAAEHRGTTASLVAEPGAAAARCFAVVPCAGAGVRAAVGGPKQYAVLGRQSVVAHTLAALAAVPRIAATLVVLAPHDTGFPQHAPQFQGPRAWLAHCGGDSRAASVAAGLHALRERGVVDHDWVVVHDAARCLLQPSWVDRLIDACWQDPVGGLLALPVADTVKSADPHNGRVSATVTRAHKHLAQTPQMFRLGLLQQALQHALATGVEVTDESSAVEAMGLAPLLVQGELENLKLTWPADFALAARLLETR
jgi:2-C-methyl-D-erythritol 4-phosphate cytidylyltransferase